MSTSCSDSRSASSADLRASTQRVLLDLVVAASIVALGVMMMMVNIILAFSVSMCATLLAAYFTPRSLPAIIIFSLLFQNTFVAFTAGYIEDTAQFDMMRALNFIIIMTAFGYCVISVLAQPRDYTTEVHRILNATWLVVAVIVAYFVVGLAVGNGKDAVIYLRNFITPIACLYVAIVCSFRFRLALLPTVVVCTFLIVIYGYCELIFQLKFLSLFNGDTYISLRMQDDIMSGLYAKQLDETGYVLRGIEDFMTVPLFNITGAGEDAIRVFRLSGPNFHPISFGYALSILNAWLLANRIRWVPVFAVPVMLFAGSKGALVLFALFVVAQLVVRIIRPKSLLIPFAGLLVIYVALTTVFGIRSQDYHVLGLMSGLREFVANPIGHGLGSGGVVSVQGSAVDWQLAQATGATSVPVESTIGVMLYQVGFGAFFVIGAVLALGLWCWRTYLETRLEIYLFGFVALWVITANAAFQEEAYFAPLALGSCMLLVGVGLGSKMRDAI